MMKLLVKRHALVTSVSAGLIAAGLLSGSVAVQGVPGRGAGQVAYVNPTGRYAADGCGLMFFAAKTV